MVVQFLQWPREEIAHMENRESGEIRVRYDTKRIGAINKSVTIQSNAMNTDNITRSKKDSDGKVIGGTSTIRHKRRSESSKNKCYANET